MNQDEDDHLDRSDANSDEPGGSFGNNNKLLPDVPSLKKTIP
jgi:hypothetical protein